MANSDALGSAFLDVRTPVKLPDALRGEKYGRYLYQRIVSCIQYIKMLNPPTL